MILITVLIVIVSVLLVLVVLAQNSKGGGLSSQFGGAGASNMIGVKKTSDLLEKITWGLAITLFALAISSKFVAETSQPSSGFTTPSIERAQEQNIAPVLDLGTDTGVDEAATEAVEEATTDEPAEEDN
jgi:preprotein translocase subunit SecG